MIDGQINREHVEKYIVDLLAGDLLRDREELHAELVAAGPEMPYDSVMLVELMSRVAERFSVSFDATYATARDLRSVRSFAERVCDEIKAREAP